jgi:hypothetical protein
MNLSVSDALRSPKLFGQLFVGSSWDRWRAVLKATYGEALTSDEETAFREVADRDPPIQRVREFVAVVGRGGGKDSIASVLAAYAAITFDPKGKLRPGENVYVMCIACDRDQAAIAFNYIRGYFEDIPALKQMVKAIGAESIELVNRVTIEVHSNSYRSVRGRSILCCIFDEAAHFRSENSASPDFELHAAVTPGLARVKGSMLVVISTVHRRAGLLWQRFSDHYGKSDGDVLLVRGTTLQFNPSFDAATIEAAIKGDPQFYEAEYNSRWRDDLQSFVSRDAVNACVDHGVRERPPERQHHYSAFCDPAGGSGKDSFTLAICHLEDEIVVVDLIREIKPPFNPSEVVAEFARAMRDYRLTKVVGDKYASQWPIEAFAKHQVVYEQSDTFKSDLYGALLPTINSGRIRLVDDNRMLHQLISLERRTFRSGKDSIDHPQGGHDDLINAVAGAAFNAKASSSSARFQSELIRRAFSNDLKPLWVS